MIVIVLDQAWSISVEEFRQQLMRRWPLAEVVTLPEASPFALRWEVRDPT
jgi:hypothetical protein